MRLETVAYKVYNYGELSQSARERVREWYLEHFKEPSIFSEYVVEAIKEAYGLEDFKTYYSLGYCQGDGICFEGKVYSRDFVEKNEKRLLEAGFTKKELARLVWLDYEGYNIEVKHSGRYYHRYSMDIEWNGDPAWYSSYAGMDKIEDTMSKFLEWFTDFLRDLCGEYEKEGYDYFYEATEEEIAECCEANGYEFLADGSLF